MEKQIIRTLGRLRGGALPYGSKEICFGTIKRLWFKGLNLSEIARELGCSCANISKRLKGSELYDGEEIEKRQARALSQAMKRVRAKTKNPAKRLRVRDKISKTLKRLYREGTIHNGDYCRFPNGHIPWNKGLTKDRDKRMRRIAEGMLGKNNHMFGRGGEKHPNWRGGYEPYYGPNWHQQRRKTLERDHHICQICSAPENGRQHDVHHVIPFKEFGLKRYREANKLENLVTICRVCHIRLEWLKYKNQSEPDVNKTNHQVHPEPVDIVF